MDWTAGKDIRQFKLDSDGAGILAFYPEGKRLARVDAHHTIHLLDENGTPDSSLVRNQSGIVSVKLSQDGKTAITLDSHGNIVRRDLQSPKETSLFQELGRDGYLGWSSDGKFLARKLPNNHISIQQVTTSKEFGQIHTTQEGAPERVVFSSDNKILAVGYREKPVSLYFLENLEKPTILPSTSAKSLPLLFSPDAKILVVSEGDHFIRLVETHTGKQLARWKKSGPPTPVVFSPDNRLVATACEEGVISLREVSTGQDIRFFQGHVGEVHGLAFSPDGRAMASGGLDFLVKIWEVSSGQEVRRFQGHAGPVTALTFTPDGRSVITGSSDTTLLIWDITGRLQHPDIIPVSLEARQLEALWESLGGSDGSLAYDSIWKLVLLPRDSLPLLRDRLQWYTEADQRRITKLIAELDDDNFAIREKASADLETMVKWAEPALRQALANDPSLEVQKRIEKILEKLKKGVPWTQERLRLTRVIEILEKIGSRQAEQELEKLAKAAPDAEIRTEANLALERLQKQK
jgi:WD40 repeat protein